MTRRPLMLAAAPLALIAAAPASAQSVVDMEALSAEIAELKAQQATTAARIAQIEKMLISTGTPAPAVAAASPVPLASGTPQTTGGAAAPINPAGGSAPGVLPSASPSRLAINGDLRVRYEANFGRTNVRDRDRGVIRARLRATYAINDRFSIGAALGTGDNDDPNSTDQTLGFFDDDLTVSLDQAYIRGNFGNVSLVGGKIPQPFVRTEMVWDGDVNPQGLSAAYRMDLGGGSTLKANALYFLIDEATGGEDSRMIGGQLQFETASNASTRVELAAGYYDFRLSNLVDGDAGDFRTNRFAGGRYLSDFNLVDLVGAVTFKPFGEKWPIRIVGDYVKNLGATTDQDTGYGIDLLIGRGSKVGDWRFGYGYAAVGVDAVLAAFSHDNTDLATNYRQHTALIDYIVMPNVTLNTTFYRYQAKAPGFTPAFPVGDWANRLRLNVLVSF